MYLWAKLIFKVLEGAFPYNNDRWEDLVNDLLRTVSAAYAKLLKRVQPDHQECIMILLYIIIAAYRPLSLNEMNIALNVRNHPSEDSVKSLNMVSDKNFWNWIINTCSFFVTEYGDKIYLIHQTAKEFLLGASASPGHVDNCADGEPVSPEVQETWSPVVTLPAAYASMAETCISYLP